jgi:hypothetical protein
MPQLRSGATRQQRPSAKEQSPPEAKPVEAPTQRTTRRVSSRGKGTAGGNPKQEQDAAPAQAVEEKKPANRAGKAAGAGAPNNKGAAALDNMKKEEGQTDKDKHTQDKKEDEAAPLPEKVRSQVPASPATVCSHHPLTCAQPEPPGSCFMRYPSTPQLTRHAPICLCRSKWGAAQSTM